MKFGVVISPGSNCDQDIIRVLSQKLGQAVVTLWHKDTDLQGVDFVILPGGFSYGDYLRSGALASLSPMMQSVKLFAAQGGYVLGICNGFQILCEMALLPGVLLRNEQSLFSCKNVYVKVCTTNSLLSARLLINQVLKIPIAHAEGRYYADRATLQHLQKHDQILLRYCDSQGACNEPSNPNGSLLAIAGICNQQRNVFGMMPHPERASDSLLGNTDGLALLDFCLAAAS